MDDDEVVARTITQFLKTEGIYEIATAFNGFNAGLEVMSFHPDLVILDLMMPYVDGFGVCQTIKSNPKTEQIKVLVATAYTEEETINRALACGADSWLGKPFKMEELKQKVEELLETRHRKGKKVQIA